MRDLPELLRARRPARRQRHAGDPGELARPAHRRGPETPIEANADQAPRRLALARVREAGASGSPRRYRALRRRGQGVLPRPARRDRRGKGRGRRGHASRSRSTVRCSTRRSPSAATCRCRPISRRAARRTTSDRADYQTLFAHDEGSVAAPTAGLHFTDELRGAAEGARHRPAHRDAACRRRHVPAGEDRRYVEEHRMHAEYGVRQRGRRDARSTRRAARAAASSRSARRRCACSKAPRTGTARSGRSRARPRSSSRRAIASAPST